MKKTAAFRVTADICFFFSILSIFPAMRPWQTPMAIFAAASFAVSLAAAYCPWWPLRLLLSLLPSLAFIGAQPGFLLIFPALGWLYLIVVLTSGRFHVWLDEYRRVYRVMLVVCLCSLAANIAHHAVYPNTVISWPSMVYALLFLFFGVIAMREMQMNANMGAAWQLTNALTVVGVPLLAIGGSVLLFLLLRWMKPAVEYLFRPIGLFFLWLFGLLIPDGPITAKPTPTPRYTDPPIVDFTQPAASEGRAVVEEGIEQSLYDPMLTERATRLGGYVVLALLLLAAIWLIVRYARRGRPVAEQDDYFYEETEKGAPPRKRRAGRTAAPGNGQQIRKIYRQYMKLMQEHGVLIQKDSTSLDILDGAEQLNLSPAAKRLRELYLKARYAEDSSISREDAQEAQRCLEEIRKEFSA